MPLATRSLPVARVDIDTPMPPPHWALLERQLLDAVADAGEAFYDRYFDARGFVECVAHWGALDGADDAAENVASFTDAYALGGSERLLQLWRQGFEGHLRQYTAAKTTEATASRDGMYYKEFPTSFDWLHNAEGFHSLFQQGLCEPRDRTFVERMERFARFYITDDPAEGAPAEPNYDPKHNILRSVLNGSRGPTLPRASTADWAGDSFPDGRFVPMRGHRGYGDYARHFETYLDVAGDVPLNLAVTALPLQAYLATGDSVYRDWLARYVGGWAERAAANDHIIPGNVGLDGVVGSAFDGRWWMGVGSWGHRRPIIPFTPEMPLKFGTNFLYRTHYAFANAMLVTRDMGYVHTWGRMLDAINSLARVEGDTTRYPHAHDDNGWTDYRDTPFSAGALHVFYWTQRPEDRARVADLPWVKFLGGEDPGYPERRLLGELEELRRRMQVVAADDVPADIRMSEDPNALNPVEMSWALVELMQGGIASRHVGVPWHVCVRYFDPVRRRAGIPEDVASLVDRLSADRVELTLVNLDPLRPRELVLQAGAYGEHTIRAATVGAGTEPVAVADRALRVSLAPGAGARICLDVDRYCNDPTLAFPWR